MTLERAMFVMESAQERPAVKVNVQTVESWMVGRVGDGGMLWEMALPSYSSSES